MAVSVGPSLCLSLLVARLRAEETCLTFCVVMPVAGFASSVAASSRFQTSTGTAGVAETRCAGTTSAVEKKPKQRTGPSRADQHPNPKSAGQAAPVSLPVSVLVPCRQSTRVHHSWTMHNRAAAVSTLPRLSCKSQFHVPSAAEDKPSRHTASVGRPAVVAPTML